MSTDRIRVTLRTDDDSMPTIDGLAREGQGAPLAPPPADDALDIFGDPIHVYTRAQAIDDGVLVDLSEWASPREMSPGFKVPVAVTRAVWSMLEAIPRRFRGIQDIRGRAHDLLVVLAFASRRGGSEARFRVLLDVEGDRRRLHEFRAVCGPGDAGEPVVTVMLPEED